MVDYHEGDCLIRTRGEAHPFPSWIAEVADGSAQAANAELIVRAVSCHAELVESLNRMLYWASIDGTNYMIDEDMSDELLRDVIAARAALANAERES